MKQQLLQLSDVVSVGCQGRLGWVNINRLHEVMYEML